MLGVCICVDICAKWSTMKHILIYSPSMSLLSQICIVRLALFEMTKIIMEHVFDNKSRIFYCSFLELGTDK